MSELTLEEPRRWNTLLLQALFSYETVREIEKIPRAQYDFHNLRDSIKWRHHPSGILSVKLAYVALNIPTHRHDSSHSSQT